MEVINYMALFNIGYKHSTMQLFRGYMNGVRKSFSTNDVELFKTYRKGYEVLRDEASFEAYHRIYRKYVLLENLNYPKIREQELITQFREKEVKGEQFVNDYQNELPSYGGFVLWLIIKFIVFDLLQIFGGGGGGILLVGAGFWAMIYFGNSVSISVGVALFLIGGLLVRFNFIKFVRGLF